MLTTALLFLIHWLKLIYEMVFQQLGTQIAF